MPGPDSVEKSRGGFSRPPGFIHSTIVAALLRNPPDVCRRDWLTAERTAGIASVALRWLRTVVMLDLQLNLVQ